VEGRAQRWRAFIVCDMDDDDEEEPYVVTYCPECAEREFGPRLADRD
jgi:hypothetical protein